MWLQSNRCRIDSIVNSFLIERDHNDPALSPYRGLVVHSHTDYIAPMSYPCVAVLGLRVNHIGKSSVTYEVGVFTKADTEVKAVGELVHVFVDSKTGKPAPDGIDRFLRNALEQTSSPDIPSRI